MTKNTPSKLITSKSAQSLNQQVFWVILPWVMAPLVMLGITIVNDHNNSAEQPAANSHQVQIDNSSQNMLFTLIFLAIGTVSCGLAVLMVRRLSEDLYRLNQDMARAAVGDFTRIAPAIDGSELPPVHAQELESLTKSSHQLIGSLQKSLLQQQAATAQTVLFSDLLRLAQNSSDAKPIYTKVVQSIKKILAADRVFVYHFAPNWSGTIETQATSAGFSHLVSQQVADAFFTRSMVEIDRYRDGRLLVVHDVAASGFKPERLQAYEKAQIKSNIVAPIMIRKQLVGLLCVQQCAKSRQWRKWEVNICANVANFLGLVLNQADVSTAKGLSDHQTNQHLHMLSKISTQFPQSSHPHDFLRTLVDELRENLNLDRAIFFQLDDKFVGEIVAESVDPNIKAINGEEIIDTCLQNNRGCGYESGRISAIDDVYTADLTECHLQMMERLEIRANIVAPVIFENSLYGLLIGHMSRAARHWQQPEIDLLAQVASQVGLVMTQTSLLKQLEWQQQFQVARDEQHKAAKQNLQRQLLELIDKTEL
jgi:methyl-accepting chemotaxis protein PixJ